MRGGGEGAESCWVMSVGVVIDTMKTPRLLLSVFDWIALLSATSNCVATALLLLTIVAVIRTLADVTLRIMSEGSTPRRAASRAL